MNIPKTVLLLLALSANIMLASGTRKTESFLHWQEQMKRAKTLIKAFGLATAPKTTRNAGLDYFNIKFEEEPTELNVHTLRPQDIDIVGAMGDSLSAANGAGAHVIPTLAIQYVGQCFSIGGDETLEHVLTVPNILKHFNDKVYGYSTGIGFGFGFNYGFNVAVPGARADDMYGQAVELVNKLQRDSRIDYEGEWKLITLFIGGNDICALDRDPDGASGETYTEEVKKALDYLHDTAKVPRMMVQIVDMIECYLLPLVGYGAGSTRQCRLMQNAFCEYLVIADAEDREHIIETNREYQWMVQELVSSGRYDTRDDFTVVTQPFFTNTHLPYTSDGRVDSHYFAPDCFHFSDIGHAMTALNLWNNMMEPVGEKATEWSLSNMKVPTAKRPYIFTNLNSAGDGASGEDPQEEEETATDCPTPEPEKYEWEIATVSTLGLLAIVEAAAIFSAI